MKIVYSIVSFVVFFQLIFLVKSDGEVTSIPSICYSISAKYKDKTILNEAKGCMFRGRLHGIIGPSGSGKTTLLNALAGQLSSNNIKISGDLIDNFPAYPSIFVQQNDILFPHLTVKETLDIAVSLRGDKTKSKDNVDRLINNLGLKKVKLSKVGDSKTRGISGGEKKRLSIGNELISCSSDVSLDESSSSSSSNLFIFLDEPTSGLDSFASQRVVELLKSLTKNGNTVVASIHQPRATVYSLFDDITIVSEGRVIYTGTRSELKPYFSNLGFKVPSNVSPAEYFVDLVSIDYTNLETEETSRDRIKKLADHFSQEYKKKYKNILKNLNQEREKQVSNKQILKKKKGGLITEIKKFGILFIRAWKQVTRDKSLNIARFMSGLFSGLLFGAIYYQLGLGASTVADRLGLLQVAAVNTAMTSLIKATTSFVTEKLIIQRERRGDSYNVGSYFISKLFAELPLAALFPCMTGTIIYFLCGLNPAPGRWFNFLKILVIESMASSAFGMAIGSFAPSVESAVAIAPAVMVIFIVFGGLYVVNAPNYLKWVPNCSLIRWAYEGLVINEFKDLSIIPEAKFGPKSVNNGNQILDNMGCGKPDCTIGRTIKSQLMIIIVNYAFTYFSLLIQKPKSQKIEKSNEDEDDKQPPKSLSTTSKKEKLAVIPPSMK